MNGRENRRRLLYTLFILCAHIAMWPAMAEAALECYTCHGSIAAQDVRPLDALLRDISSGGFRGNHRTHMGTRVSVAESGRCSTCHPGSEAYNGGHRDGKIKLSSNINHSPIPAVYVNHTSTFRGWTSAFPQTPRPVLGTCTNVNCHFEKNTPTWSVTPFSSLDQCNSCHDAPPSDGSHLRKHDTYFGTDPGSCVKCHPDHRTDPNVFAHATSAGKRPLSVLFTAEPNNGGSYGGPGSSNAYPDYLPSQNPERDGTCTNLYCHSDGRGGPANATPALTWSDKRSTQCYSCHRGRSTRTTDNTPQISDSTFANCTSTFGVWSSAKGYCTPSLTMESNAHRRLVGAQWVRKYPCYYCHNATMDAAGTVKAPEKHLNRVPDVEFAPQWEIGNRDKPTYDPNTKICNNIYCHSDGTVDPDDIRPAAWTDERMKCNSCHGHPKGTCSDCHDGKRKFLLNNISTVLSVQYAWPAGQDWKESLPMFSNQGPGTGRANSHPRHVETNFTCDHCHSDTIYNGTCTSCHQEGIPSKSMTEEAHINAVFHVNKDRDVSFKDGGHWDPVAKTCSGTVCHTGTGDTDPIWGGSVNSGITCLSCHSTTTGDVDSFGFVFDGTQARINKTEWETYGHGRYSSAANTGSYPKSGNPAANFPGNPCWYCHDNNVLHNYSTNPFRLRQHPQYKKRFEKECVYCHMQRTDAECISCHVGQPDSLSPQATANGIAIKYKFNNLSTLIMYPTHTDLDNCTLAGCHDSDNGTFPESDGHKGHDSNAGTWTEEEKKDIENQYMMMGVCLQCHDDDTGNQCTSCHVPPPGDPDKFALGFNPGTGYIKPRKARASGGHFGYKHYRAFTKTGGWTKVDGKASGVWKGGKFCWDCHDPHGDANIYMVHKQVATTTEGLYGVPLTRAVVNFTDNQSGTSYAKKTGTIDAICNVCHSTDSKHFTSSGGDGHNLTRRCTSCHEHRFADSHAGKQSCDTCHSNEKPIPKHTSFGLPRDCTKCHAGTIGKRMDVMGQMKSNSHHVQGIEVTNKHCYECHWESTPIGLIDNQYHTGYNYISYTSVKNDVVDLVLYGKRERPTVYRNTSTADGKATAITFLATNMGTELERGEVSNISNHCLSCHNDENNDAIPFGDCKTPRQYAWDLQSIKSRYSQSGTTTWGKYPATTNAAQKNIVKSFSAHGNGVANGGGFSATTGLDGVITDTRGGPDNENVQCFDCHNSHGSKVVGITSSYVTFNGTNNGANLKETKKDMGGYRYDYKASANASGVNPYGAGAGQCFDCHNTANAGDVVPTGRTPWGYSSTFGATAPIMGYKDTPRFGQGTKAFITRYPFRESKKTIVGGHMKASVPAGALPGLAKESGTASSGTILNLTSSGKNWTPENKWRNFYVLIDGGSNSGQLRKITGSTTDTLTFEEFNYDVAAGDTFRIVPYSAPVNGLCTPCHDPHGVSPVLGDNQKYAVPLLKGTWMTSPYKDDNPQPTLGTRIYATPTWKLDRNTFATGFSTNNRIKENDTEFAGLCINCHKKELLTNGTNGDSAFKSLDRAHESVKGWGANAEHSFSCSKCHQPHNSGLPRLMQTNCLNYTHRGVVPSGGSVSGRSGWRGGNWYGFPRGNYTALRCHNDNRENGVNMDWNHLPEYPANYRWNDLTPWP